MQKTNKLFVQLLTKIHFYVKINMYNYLYYKEKFMKKKLLFISFIATLMICLFAICASAEDYTPNFGSMTKVDGMADKATFGNDGKFDTCKSRVLMNDNITYPAYYILADQATMKIDFSKLNTNAAKSYDRSSIVAFELCEGITHIASCYTNNGFQGDRFTPNIEYLRVPSSLVDISTDAPFYHLSNLKVVDNFENTSVTAIPKRGFEGCPIEKMKFPSSLQTIAGGSLNAFAGELDLYNTAIQSFDNITFQNNKSIKGVVLPSGLTTIGNSAFKSCSALTYVVAGANLINVGQEAFSGCSSLKTIDFSKTQLETIGLRSFFDCHSLEVANLGHIKKIETQSFYKAGINTDKGCVKYYISGKLEVIHNEYGQIMQDAKMAVIYYTGTNSDTGFSLLKSNALKNGAANWATVDAKSEGYDKNATYEANTIIYNYNTCDAFHGGNHQDPTTVVGFEGAEYFTKYQSSTGCQRCKQTTVTDLANALFTYKGFSTDGNSIVYDIRINKDAIKAYNDATGKEIKYGIVASQIFNDGALLDNEGVIVDNRVVSAEFSGSEYSILQIKILNVAENLKTTPIHCCAYVVDGSKVKYLYDTKDAEGKAVPNAFDVANQVSYSQIK